jgi:predicted amidohydrolase YtcJ
VRFTLDAYARAGGRGHRLEHLETLPDDLVRAVARSGYTASMQPVHLNAIGPNWNERLGPERAARAFRMRDLLDAGAPLTLGSDWPVGDADPRLGMIAARRHGLAGEEALAGYTLAPARAVGDAGGRIRVGLRADLTGMAEDPVHAPDAPVWLTVVAGRVVHHHGDVVARRLRPAAEAVPSDAGRSRQGAHARG